MKYVQYIVARAGWFICVDDGLMNCTVLAGPFKTEVEANAAMRSWEHT